MRATLILADAAQVAEGKLYVLGGGWTFTGPAPAPMAIGCLIDVPWDQTNRKIPFRIQLLDADGEPAELAGAGRVDINGQFETGRPAGLPPGSPITVPFAVNLGALPLQPGRRYEWRLTLDGETDDDWILPFNTRPSA
ncbi:MAG: DUF6941 family protein [Acidimicrobiales bacterium]